MTILKPGSPFFPRRMKRSFIQNSCSTNSVESQPLLTDFARICSCILSSVLILSAAASSFTTNAACAEEAAPSGKPALHAGLLKLKTGDEIPGAFRAIHSPSAIRWQGTSFTQPFEFEPALIRVVQFPAEPMTESTEEFSIELASGDRLDGRFLSWTKERIEFETPLFGVLHLRPESLRRIDRTRENSQLIFAGLRGLTDWNYADGKWHEDGATLWTTERRAILVRDLEIPERAIFEFTFSWKKNPHFVFALGVNNTRKIDRLTDGWRFEAWGDGVNMICERQNVADIVAVEGLVPSGNRMHLIVYLDQVAGEMHAYHPNGKLAGQLKLPQDNGKKSSTNKPGHSVRLINRRGETRFEQLRITRWNGGLPSADPSILPQFRLADGTTTIGSVTGLEKKSNQLQVLSEDQQAHSFPISDVISAQFTPPADDALRPVSLLSQDGLQISGVIDTLEDHELRLVSPDIDEPLRIPYEEIRSLTFTEDAPVLEAPGDGAGQLVVKEHKSTGHLVSGVATQDSSCLHWQPQGSRTSSPLRPDASGRIVNLKHSSKKQTKEDKKSAGKSFASLFLKKTERPSTRSGSKNQQTIHLRTGDIIPCDILFIDEEGVKISSPVIEASFIPHSRIKAAELVPQPEMPDLAAAKKNRLLTLPRLQKASPPTQLLCSRNGDFLRCRLISMRDGQLVVEIQLEEIELPANRVAQIIWFHPDELKNPETPAAETPATESPSSNSPVATTSTDEGSTEGESPQVADESKKKADTPFGEEAGLVQVIRSDGKRMTFTAQKVDNEKISGVSDILGMCQLPLSQIDQLIFGTQIQLAAAKLPYHQWHLHPAVEPLVAQDLPASGDIPGGVSPLVGKPAPPITLDLLDGGTFKLSDCKGQIVVLDFWATWCGPCMQTMPLLHQLMDEFNPQQVKFVSVNLEEPADHVRSVLERHKLDFTVALDIDGVTARRYEANAIPQLVVVNRKGEVAQLYVGGGPGMIERLRETLQEQLKTEK